MYGCYECQACGREFNTEGAMAQHMDVKGHWPAECACCTNTYVDEENCREHEYIDHNYCSECDRGFINYNNLRMHLNSSRHRSGSMACPFCNTSLTTATGLAHHLECNACPNVSTGRESLYHYVRCKDPNRLIAKRMIGWNGVRTAYEASSATWNGVGYECYLCHRNFGSLQGLSQHLNSATHQQSLYHCPNRNCRDFKTLAGIINHLESETCGIARFETVQKAVSQTIGSGRLLSF
ncbi:zinc finger protein, putative [Cordyceps militaris CM01]|uniref:Zinc finger protein, putative n=2 Tax=Cordyceps militaris TaxID=73501 RepID=G3J534_CORMM|nr:zinc finger protein, putative [Cordyceps militaris CM01]ATY65703.1 zinc finger protein [Cordyceps militaris]EGX95948.1 zinc finger protein, putative [Cordyceps militaris CM01]